MPSQWSHEVKLVSGQRYYIELLGGEIGGNDHFAAGVQFPGGKFIGPITFDYLFASKGDGTVSNEV